MKQVLILIAIILMITSKTYSQTGTSIQHISIKTGSETICDSLQGWKTENAEGAEDALAIKLDCTEKKITLTFTTRGEGKWHIECQMISGNNVAKMIEEIAEITIFTKEGGNCALVKFIKNGPLFEQEASPISIENSITVSLKELEAKYLPRTKY